MSTRITPNSREILYAQDSNTGQASIVTATNNKLNVNATASLAGSSIPISGATTAVGVAIVDSSGNQISSFGGGTQYTDGGVPPTHPIGNTIEWSDGANWQTVSTAKPLPVTANAGTNLNTSALALDSTVAKDASLTTLNTSVNTLLKPASTLTKVTTVDTITNPVGVTGTFWQPTQPVSAASLPLPLGASTAANQLFGLMPKTFDSITYTATSGTVDTYQYFTGGTGGTLVATLTVTYTASDHVTLVSVVRT